MAFELLSSLKTFDLERHLTPASDMVTSRHEDVIVFQARTSLTERMLDVGEGGLVSPSLVSLVIVMSHRGDRHSAKGRTNRTVDLVWWKWNLALVGH